MYHVSGGVDTCCIGFLRRHLLKYKDEYDGRFALVTEVFDEHSESPSDRESIISTKDVHELC